MAETEREPGRETGVLLAAAGRRRGSRRRELFWLLVVAMAFAAAMAWRWRFACMAQIYTYDSYYYMVLARNLRYGLEYAVAGNPHFKFMPFYPLTITFTYIFTGNLEFAGKFSNVFLASACVFPIYAIGKEVFSRRAGVAAAFLFAFEPITTAWSSIPMSEGLFTFLVCMAVLFFVYWMKGGRKSRLYLCAAAAGLTAVTRWEGFLVLGFIGAFMLFYWWKGRLRVGDLTVFSVIALVPFGLFTLRNLLVFGTPIKSAYFDEMGTLPELFELVGPGERLWRYLRFSDLEPIGISRWMYHYGYLALGYAGLALAFTRRKLWPYAAFIAAWLVAMGPAHFFWYFLSVRFLFPAVPALCLGAGALLGVPWGVDMWRLKGHRAAEALLCLLAAAMVLVLALTGRTVTNDIFTQNIRQLEDDVGGLAARDALEWLKDNAGDANVTTGIGPMASFYLGRDALFLGEWHGFEPANIRREYLLEDAREQGVRYVLVYAWEPDPTTGLIYAGVDPALEDELRLVGTWYAPPQIVWNSDVYAWVFEVPGVAGAP